MDKSLIKKYTLTLEAIMETDQQAIKDFKVGKITVSEYIYINKTNVEVVKKNIRKSLRKVYRSEINLNQHDQKQNLHNSWAGRNMIVGFSFVAVLAYLIAKKYTYKKAIFASMSPIHNFSYETLVKDYLLHMNKDKAVELAKDIKSIKIDTMTIDTPFITIIGEEEKELLSNGVPNIIIQKTKHYMSKKYIETISGLL